MAVIRPQKDPRFGPDCNIEGEDGWANYVLGEQNKCLCFGY